MTNDPLEEILAGIPAPQNKMEHLFLSRKADPPWDILENLVVGLTGSLHERGLGAATAQVSVGCTGAVARFPEERRCLMSS